MATIVILTHDLQRHFNVPYMVLPFAERWRELGHEVLVHHGAGEAPAGDLAIQHVDLTVIPEAYRALARRYPRTVNARVVDISKSGYSQLKVGRDSDWRGPVIVKTEENDRGRPEAAMRAMAARTGGVADFGDSVFMRDYPIYRSLAAVPEKAWSYPGVLMEKFMPERDAKGFYLRVWTFLGDRERCSRWRSTQPIVKADSTIERENAEVPDEIRAWRERLGFDYGKFDFVRHEGRWLLLDVNKTPSAPPTAQVTGGLRERLFEIADGVKAFL